MVFVNRPGFLLPMNKTKCLLLAVHTEDLTTGSF